ncbi:MAG: putative lipid II flippase FtsW [Mesorhizobium sp.]|uniref:putative lipid II flippase FtsW n=1 Tax=unclassified Mesorhizobium TaxID=325217 RepID=UPI000F74EC4A|nr:MULTISPECIES: putative lipid II flippase FtsW [unclassified Mesorhizobium]AZO46401.1 putative lipid II flippase FtsW [Mesorhizobium sp. M4B.F.Ca.ET.058.02.1.1]RUX48191.1 putative lipid II flippase FtsW [Mesorhizobium sp. M4A.F.Ca.ET.050.02.1.1]RVC41273.1 putative lipid II flippase FtsW [Mesorhizobium sp. M4A.F.Ca.ET.090.04.2.1]RVC73590.1 putative lipid II flippase FtsW [Mesorhizobium sp. M4A.F.Ca.ET.022.05.2.1]RVD37468.1 putative lipid II flippase FtsW [Mesorhizobium sp. M4A.F.Ca.ET.020.02.
MQSRLDKSPVATWWWTIDRWFLAAFLSLMGLGIVLSFAASPAVAERIGLDSFHFATRQIIFTVPALGVMLAVSFLESRQIRRMALVILCTMLVLMVAVLYVGVEVKGARRWVSLAGLSIQPSEFLKPAFVIVCAWLFAEHKRQPDIPGNLFALLLLVLVVSLLVAQPDLGQTMLVTGTWGVMFFMAGLPWLWIIALGVTGVSGLFAAYTVFPHVAARIDKFLTGEGDTFQVDMGREALINGHWFGVGPGEGTVKRVIPDSHADFVFSVAGEEFGLVMCFFIMSIFAFIVLRGLNTALKEHDDFARYAVGGLVTVFGLQSAINMCVNLQLMPAKGMTLPFISYGGSSQIAIAISMGMVLALTRRRPEKRKQMGFSFPQRAMPAE